MGIVIYNERGASSVEYGLMVAFIAGVIFLAVLGLGGATHQLFTDSCTEVRTGVVAAGHSPGANC